MDSWYVLIRGEGWGRCPGDSDLWTILSLLLPLFPFPNFLLRTTDTEKLFTIWTAIME